MTRNELQGVQQYNKIEVSNSDGALKIVMRHEG